ncbi:MAG: uroporphyrinogen-III C-methyltransferase [Rhodospirillales bacterium]|nr:uroporphyrinogen-III C-methyltransferase [Rhodospirillales bacterium]
MKHLPAFIDINERFVLVVGGGAMAWRRTAMAQRAGARVVVVAPELVRDFESCLAFEHRARPFDASDLAGITLVYVACEEDPDYETRVAAAVREQGLLVNVADRSDISTFIMPSIVDRSPIVVAISSGGEAPILARMLRAKLESLVPAALGALAAFAGSYRDRVKELIPDIARRRRFWERVADGSVAENILGLKPGAAEARMEQLLEAARQGLDVEPAGEVYLVGSGPGDPDLLTFRALRLMQQADVVLHDRLVPDGILELVRRDADRIYVGKKQGDHSMQQQDISRTLVDLAKQGKRVLRLKGGDPFVFGRGGEEIEMLSAEGISFQVVPGISAANGCAAYAGIPLTHRDHAQACVFVTGHAKDDKLDLNWQALIQPNQTVVVYMGLISLAQVMGELIAHGADPKTLVAVVDKGTRVDQRVVTGAIGTIVDAVEKAALTGPAIIIIGSVVSLRDRLEWFADEGDTGSVTRPG